MSKKKKALGVLFFSTPVLYVICALWAFWSPVGSSQKMIQEPALKKSSGVIEPLPLVDRKDYQKYSLGQRLFYEKKLSPDESVSCASCHDLKLGGADNKEYSTGSSNTKTSFNTPSILNASYNISQFWDGRIKSLSMLIEKAPEHIGHTDQWNWENILKHIEKDETYGPEFRAVYKELPNALNMQDALYYYVGSLVTLHSRFDRFLEGQTDILSPREKRGYELFKNYGCTSCHQGRNIGGNIFQKFGVIVPYFTDENKTKPENLGRYNVTGDKRDENVFKVPSLRNVALTAPYYHNGSVETLEQAISEMAYYQLGLALSHDDVRDISAFLSALTSEAKK